MEDILLFSAIALVAGGFGYALGRSVRAGRSGDSTRPRVQDPEPADREAIEPIVESLSEGVILLNDLFRPVLSNAAARRLSAIEEGPAGLVRDEVMSVARRAFTSRHRVEEAVDLWNPDRTSVLVSAEVLANQGGVLVTLRDISSEQRALRQRRQFVSHASHELKSPVASIQALAEAMAQAAADDTAAVEQFAQKMLRETERVAKLVRDLLDLSRIEDPASFRREPVDVSRLALKLVEDVGAEISSKRLRLETRIEGRVWTQADQQQISLLIRNLLDNAIRYTGEGGLILLEVERDANQAVVRVTDDGIGIPMKAQARVFERFFRVDEARSRDQGGSGLGLAIVKHVADLYGGRVELRSEFGEGSTFTAYLPAISAGRRDQVPA